MEVYLVGRRETEWDSVSPGPTYFSILRREEDAQADADARNKQEFNKYYEWKVEKRVGIPFQEDPDQIVVLDKMAPWGSCFVHRVGVTSEGSKGFQLKL